MSKQRDQRARRSKRQPSDDFDPDIAIRRLYRALVVVEALAVMADEAATMLPLVPSGKHRRTLARLMCSRSTRSRRVATAIGPRCSPRSPTGRAHVTAPSLHDAPLQRALSQQWMRGTRPLGLRRLRSEPPPTDPAYGDRGDLGPLG